jgi:hypothetical protein
MPRYFFHIHDGTALIDPDGIELPGPDEARGEAVRVAFDALNKLGPRFRESGKWLLRATDENGETICLLTFSGEVPAQLGRVASG